MLEFEVRVSPEEFRVTGGGSVTGPIWARIAGTDFPEPGWPDFPVALLGGWLTTLAELEADDGGLAMLHFMEGPYRLDVTREGAAWALRAHQDGAEPVAEVTADSLAELRGPLCDAAEQVLAACRARGWRDRDVRHLTGVTSKP